MLAQAKFTPLHSDLRNSICFAFSLALGQVKSEAEKAAAAHARADQDRRVARISCRGVAGGGPLDRAFQAAVKCFEVKIRGEKLREVRTVFIIWVMWRRCCPRVCLFIWSLLVSSFLEQHSLSNVCPKLPIKTGDMFGL